MKKSHNGFCRINPSWFQPPERALNCFSLTLMRELVFGVILSAWFYSVAELVNRNQFPSHCLPISMIAIRATRRGKIRLHLPTVELGLVAEPLVLPVELAEQVVPAAVAVRNSFEQAVQVVAAEHTSAE
jgi:hypothetical protein